MGTAPCVTVASLYKQCWLLHTKKMQRGIFSTLSCSTLCFLASTVKLCNNIYIQMLTVIFHPGKRRCHLKVPCVMQSRDLTRGLAYGVGVDFNCLKRDHFKKWNSLSTKAHSPGVKVILLFRSCFWKGAEGPALAFPRSYLWKHPGEQRSLTVGLRQLSDLLKVGSSSRRAAVVAECALARGIWFSP